MAFCRKKARFVYRRRFDGFRIRTLHRIYFESKIENRITDKKMKKTDFSAIFLIMLSVTILYRLQSADALYAQEAKTAYPRMEKLHTSDALFKQYSKDVRESYKTIARGDDVQALLYTYRAKADDDLLSIAARCNIPYETIALINNLEFIDSPLNGRDLYLCTCPGLFIAENPVTPLEFILKTRYPETQAYVAFSVNNKRYAFIPDKRLNPTERFFFADSSMISPLEKGVISSSFGMRTHPITGRQTFHNGIDIAAPAGTPVVSCKSGTVAFTGTNERYGNYIILQHGNNTQSLYAHLQKILIEKDAAVQRGGQIGIVGSTGMSTGPHLHFEIRVGGKAKDPSSLVRRFLRE